MPHTFRIATGTTADFDFLMSIARLRYLSPLINWDEAERWLRMNFANPAAPIFMGQRSFAVLHIAKPLWEPRPMAILGYYAARPGRDLEPLALLRHLAAYAKSRGCSSLDAGADTASDLSPFFRRLGARNIPRFRVEL